MHPLYYLGHNNTMCKNMPYSHPIHYISHIKTIINVSHHQNNCPCLCTKTITSLKTITSPLWTCPKPHALRCVPNHTLFTREGRVSHRTSLKLHTLVQQPCLLQKHHHQSTVDTSQTTPYSLIR